jgi:hypothetical protein
MLSMAQGDLLLILTDTIPGAAIELPVIGGNYVLAHSETGHHHTVPASAARLFREPGQSMCAYLRVDTTCEVTHHRAWDTHAPITLQPGTYKVYRQREYVPGGWQQVKD